VISLKSLLIDDIDALLIELIPPYQIKSLVEIVNGKAIPMLCDVW
jgi:hypothetical protein